MQEHLHDSLQGSKRQFSGEFVHTDSILILNERLKLCEKCLNVLSGTLVNISFLKWSWEEPGDNCCRDPIKIAKESDSQCISTCKTNHTINMKGSNGMDDLAYRTGLPSILHLLPPATFFQNLIRRIIRDSPDLGLIGNSRNEEIAQIALLTQVEASSGSHLSTC